jgi:nicotinamidase-related amidase
MTKAQSLLQPQRCALLVVDLQQKLLPAIHERDRVLRSSLLLLRLAETLGLPVVLTTQYAKGLGPTVPEVLALVPEVVPLDKVSFDCFGDAGIRARLGQLEGRDQLLVCGMETHICVAQTVLSALAEGYQAHVVTDAVGSRTEASRQVGLGRMQQAGAVVSSAEMAIYELLGRSDIPAFKTMLPHLK